MRQIGHPMKTKAKWLACLVAVLALVVWLWLDSSSRRGAPVRPLSGGSVSHGVEREDAGPRREPPAPTALHDDRRQALVEMVDAAAAPRAAGERMRISVRLLTSTGESLDEPFAGDVWHGGYAARIEVIPTSEPLPVDRPTSDLRIARLRCGTYTRSRSVPERSFSGVVADGVAGVIELHRPPPAHALAMLRGRVLASARIESTTREVVLVIDPDRVLGSLGGVTFLLVDANSGEPIAKAGIRLSEAATGEWANPFQLPLEDGRFLRRRLPPGGYELQIRLPGYDHFVRDLEVDPGATTDLGLLRIEHGGAVSGRVVDESGEGLSVALQWSDPHSSGARVGPRFIRMQGSEADGRFVMAELPPKAVMLQIADPRWALDPLTIQLSPGAVLENVVVQARTGVPVTLDARIGDDVEHELVLRRADGVAIWSAAALGPASLVVRLLPGSYSLGSLTDGIEAASRAFHVADQPMTVVLIP